MWVPSTTDKHTYLWTEGGVVMGTVRMMANNKKFLATTNRNYLGQYQSLRNAQQAVEVKRGAEIKASGKIVT